MSKSIPDFFDMYSNEWPVDNAMYLAMPEGEPGYKTLYFPRSLDGSWAVGIKDNETIIPGGHNSSDWGGKNRPTTPAATGEQRAQSAWRHGGTRPFIMIFMMVGCIK